VRYKEIAGTPEEMASLGPAHINTSLAWNSRFWWLIWYTRPYQKEVEGGKEEKALGIRVQFVEDWNQPQVGGVESGKK